MRDLLAEFAGTLERLRASVGGADPATALESILAATGYEEALAEEGPEGVERLDNVRELIAGAAEWAEVAEPAEDEQPGDTLIQRYLTQAALVTAMDEGDAGAGSRVTLMTVHTAKGLERPVVALAGLEEGLFPLGRAAGEEGGLEEERRLCYVGLTRARERLYLSWARARYRYGRLELAEPSRFLDALPPHALARRSTGARWGLQVRERARPRRRAAAVDDVDFPPAEEVSQDAPRYAAGERVRHRRFGSGVVEAVTGRGRDLKVTVAFDDEEIGVKQLPVVYAGLERDWET